MAFLTGSCMPDEREYEAAEQQKIDDYLADNPNLNFDKKASGLYFLELTPGTGTIPEAHDTAFITYTGKFLDGQIFDTNVGKPNYVFPVGEGVNIVGIDEGISYMKPGGKALMLIPSKLGYGSIGSYFIPGYTPLLFEVTLVKVEPGPAK